MDTINIKINKDIELAVPVALQAIYTNFEPVTASIIHQTLAPGGLFIDIGANFGFFSLLASALLGEQGAVIAVEASPEVYPQFLKNIQGSKNISAFNVALGDREGVTNFFMTDDYVNSGVAQSPFLVGGREVQVPITTLGSLISTHPELIRSPSMIKLDVQGDEMYVLEGARDFIKGELGIKLIIEWAPAWMRNAGSDPELLPEYLAELGLTNLTVIDDWLGKTMSLGEMIDEFRKDQTGKRFCNLLAEK
jgi:FkbM family methyltransferase